MGTIGNSFDVKSVKYGHARKVWREITDIYPAGGVISNIADWVEVGKIPAGTPVKYDISNKKIEALTDTDIAAGDVATLGINGFLQEDIVVASSSTVGTGTVVYGGEIYGYMFADATLTALGGVGAMIKKVLIVA